MITNMLQYRITTKEIRRFEEAIAAVREQGLDPATDDGLFRKIQVDAMQSQLADLRHEIKEYDALRLGQRPLLELDSFEQLPQGLIAARIAAGLTQGELAGKLGIHEQQVQRYEASNYASASMQRVQEVIRALGVGVREDVLLPAPAASPKRLFAQLGAAGFSRELLVRRILPADVRAGLEQAEEEDDVQAHLALQAASAVGRVCGVSPAVIFAADPLRLDASPVGLARFSVRANANERRLTAYAVYAHYLSRLVLQATPGLTPRLLPTAPAELRAMVIAAYGGFGFEQVLRYAWDSGVAVLPLNDPGAFQGACWRVAGRNVVVLKQQTMSESRWLIDLVHELCHAEQYPEQAELAVVEDGETLRERKGSQEERRAVRFAVAAALDGRQEELAELCVHRAGGSVERLNAEVPRIAAEERVDVGVLADYLAYRLTFEQPPVNWWATATNLQPRGADPWQVTRAVLLERVDLVRLDEFDRKLLVRALAEPED